MSSLTWLAHSEEERRRTLDVVRLLDEPGTLDELGIGGIRDAFAELLFPGTSTIQTRARYFLFIPWIYSGLERRAPISDAAGRAHREEVKLIEALVESNDTDGVIGKEARANLQRLPSAIYWQGLEAWGVRRVPISIRAYHRLLERGRFRALGGEDEGGERRSLWHSDLPSAPDHFPSEVGLALTAKEAEYLHDMVMTRLPETLLSALMSDPEHAKRLPDAPWELDNSILATTATGIREQLRHAKAFSTTIHGAQLLYNLMVAEAAGREEHGEAYRARIGLWADGLLADRDELARWSADLQRFWEIVRKGNPRLRAPAQTFAERWFNLAFAGDPRAIASDPQARSLIAARERALKGRLARLENRSALDAWNGASGSERLLYRWPVARTLIEDIAEPLVDRGTE